MPCNPINPILNKYESWDHSSSWCKKNLLAHTAPLPLLPTVLAKMAWEIIKLPYALITAPLHVLVRSIRVMTCMGERGQKLQKILYSPGELLSTLGKVFQLAEALLYSLIALFNVKATIGFFKGAGLFESKRDQQEMQQKIDTVRAAAIATELRLNNVADAITERLAEAQTEIQGLQNQVNARPDHTAEIEELRNQLQDAEERASQAEGLSTQATRELRELQDQHEMAQNLSTQQIEGLTADKTRLERELVAAQSVANNTPNLNQTSDGSQELAIQVINLTMEVDSLKQQLAGQQAIVLAKESELGQLAKTLQEKEGLILRQEGAMKMTATMHDQAVEKLIKQNKKLQKKSEKSSKEGTPEADSNRFGRLQKRNKDLAEENQNLTIENERLVNLLANGRSQTPVRGSRRKEISSPNVLTLKTDEN